MSPTSKALKWLEAEGYLADVVERRITRTLKKDLFGMFDIVAIGDKSLAGAFGDLETDDWILLDTKGVQVTSKSNMAARVKKIKANPQFEKVKKHFAIEVWGFAPGKSKAAMIPRIVEL